MKNVKTATGLELCTTKEYALDWLLREIDKRSDKYTDDVNAAKAAGNEKEERESFIKADTLLQLYNAFVEECVEG